MDWDGIKYIFQIPISWYRKIHNMVFHAYGTNFLTVRQGYYGGLEVGVDSDGFAAEVNRAIDLSGYVKAVDGQTPDGNGNIALSGYVKSVDDQTPDEYGNIELSGVVKTIDGEEPDEYGNIELSDYYVTIDTDQTITGEKTFSQSIILSSYGVLESDADYVRLAYGSTNGITIAGENNNRQQLLDDEPARLYSTGADNQIATRGYCRLNFARASELSGYVRSVNNTLPDENGNVSVDIPDVPENIVTSVNGQTGNVDLGNIVNSVNDIAPVNGNVTLDIVDMDDVEDYVGEQLTNYVQQTDLTDYVQQNELTDYALTSDLDDYALTSDLADYALTSDLTGYVQTVDGKQPDANGAIDFNLGNNKWMKTNSSGHIATTNETPISLSAGNNGYLYSNNGSLEFKQDEFVTLSTAQVITGSKVFENKQYFQKQNDAGGTTAIDGEVVSINGGGGVPGITMLYESGVGGQITRGQSGLQLYDTTSIGVGAPHIVLSAYSIVYCRGDQVNLNGNGINLSAPANYVTLGNSPNTNAPDNAVATVGYIKNQLSGYTTTTPIKMVTNVTWNGTQIVIESKNLGFKNGQLTAVTNNTNTTINTVAYTP